MLKEIILHIGTEKTGTTSIQEYLFRNKDKLRDDGYLYPNLDGIPNHVGLTVTSQKFDPLSALSFVIGVNNDKQSISLYQNDMWDRFEKELGKHQYHTAIFSNEHLHSRLRHADEIEQIFNIMRRYSSNITIISYFRRQIEMAISSYSTIVREGGSQLNILSPVPAHDIFFNYFETHNLWQPFSTKFVARNFDPLHLFESNVISDFLMTCGIESFVDKSQQSNKSLGRLGLLFMLSMNSAGIDYTNSIGRDHILGALDRMADDEQLLPSRSDAMAFQAIFDRSNEQFYSLMGTSFPQFSKSFKRYPEHDPVMQLTSSEYARLTYYLLNNVT